MKTKSKRLTVAAGGVLVLSALMTGQAFAANFGWTTSESGPGFVARSWYAPTSTNAITLYTCAPSYGGQSGRVSISLQHENSFWPDDQVGSSSWSCDNVTYSKQYPNYSSGNFHWTLDSTPSGCSSPDGECPVNMSGREWYT